MNQDIKFYSEFNFKDISSLKEGMLDFIFEWKLANDIFFFALFSGKVLAAHL